MNQAIRATQPHEVKGKLDLLRAELIQRGTDLGFLFMDSNLNFKLGYPFMIYGLPGSGKSEVWWELSINLAEYKNYNHFIFSPESGTTEDVIAKIIERYIGKPIRKLNANKEANKFAMTEGEYETGFQFVNNHFVVLDANVFDGRITLLDVYKAVDEIEKDTGKRFHTITIDPFVELDKMNPKDGHEEEVRNAVNIMRKDGLKNKRSTVIIHHIAKVNEIYHKDSNSYYTPVPSPTQLAGGQMWFRKMFTIVLIYRPSPDMFDNVEANETWIMPQKIKPEGTGKLSKNRMFWDWKSKRFYESHQGTKLFSDNSKLRSKTPF